MSQENAFLISVGGSGSKVMEGLLHMLAVGGERQKWPETIHILVVETDRSNGNLKRLEDLVASYQGVQHLIKGSSHLAFSTNIELYHWTPVNQDDDQENKMRSHLSANPDAELLSSLLFQEAELGMPIDVGFQGRPAIGVAFFQHLLDKEKENMQNSAEGKKSKLAAFFEAAEQAARIMVIGSCFGGTGATGIPVMRRFIRDRFKEKNKAIHIGLLMLLPTFGVPVDPNKKAIGIRSETFSDKVKTVLSYYANTGILAEGKQDGYDQVFLLGYPKPINFPSYSVGKQSQVNPATFFDWFGSVAIHQFFSAKKTERGIFISYLEDKPWDFARMSAEFPTIETDITMMLQIAVIYQESMSQSLQDLVQSQLQGKSVPISNVLDRYSHLAEFFPSWDGTESSTIERDFQPFESYIEAFVVWLYQILTYIPTSFPRDLNGRALAAFHEIGEKTITELEQLFAKEPTERVGALTAQMFVKAPYLYRLNWERKEQLKPRISNDDLRKEPLLRTVLSLINIIEEQSEKKELGACLNELTAKRLKPSINQNRVLGSLWDVSKGFAASLITEPVSNGKEKEAQSESSLGLRYLIRALIEAVAICHNVY